MKCTRESLWMNLLSDQIVLIHFRDVTDPPRDWFYSTTWLRLIKATEVVSEITNDLRHLFKEHEDLIEKNREKNKIVA